MSSLRVVASAMAACLLVLPVDASAAWAGDEPPSRAVLRDTRGDVWFWNDSPGGPTLVGKKPTVDVVRAGAAHRPRAVTSLMRVVDLRRVGRFQQFETRIQTPTSSFAVWVVARQSNRAGRHVLFSFDTGERVRCPGLAHDVDYAANRVMVSVPRACIGTPNWVRLRFENSLAKDGGVYLDNPHNDEAWAAVNRTVRLFHP